MSLALRMACLRAKGQEKFAEHLHDDQNLPVQIQDIGNGQIEIMLFLDWPSEPVQPGFIYLCSGPSFEGGKPILADADQIRIFAYIAEGEQGEYRRVRETIQGMVFEFGKHKLELVQLDRPADQLNFMPLNDVDVKILSEGILTDQKHKDAFKLDTPAVRMIHDCLQLRKLKNERSALRKSRSNVRDGARKARAVVTGKLATAMIDLCQALNLPTHTLVNKEEA